MKMGAKSFHVTGLNLKQSPAHHPPLLDLNHHEADYFNVELNPILFV